MTYKHYLLLATLIVAALSSCCDDDSEPIVTDCDELVFISSAIYEQSASDHYTIASASVTEDCLSITFSASGCDGSSWVMSLVDADAIMESNPPQRLVRMVLDNNEACLAVFMRTVSFDISELQVSGTNEILLNLEGVDERISYVY